MALRIAVTGATGFVGRHVVRALTGAGHDVIALLRPTSNSAVVGAPLAARWLPTGRIDPASLVPLLDGCSAVVHAATAYGPLAHAPDAVETVNVGLPLALLEAAAAAGCGRFVHLDSFFSRPALVHGHRPGYTEAKRRFLREARAMPALDRIQLTNVRLEHVYGPEDAPTKFVPWLIDGLLAPAGFLPLTRGHERRDFVHVDDVARAIVLLTAAPSAWPGASDDIEVGTGRSLPVRAFVELAHRLCASTARLEFGARPDPDPPLEESAADSRRLHDLGWAPRVPLAQGLRALIDWYRRRAASRGVADALA